jgi:membrane protein implicated in regulation of membrane protease activity
VRFKDKIKPLDDLFISLFLFAPIVPIMAAAFGLEQKLIWFPYAMFLAWVIYIYGYRARYVLQDYDELSMIERARGVTYFFCLIITILLNSYVVFFPTPENRIVIIVSVGIILAAIEIIVPRVFFSRQTELFSKDQKKIFNRTLALASAVCIYYSMTIATVNQAFFEFLSVNPSISALIVISIIVVLVGSIFIYPREKDSRQNAERLATSLGETEWLKRYTTAKERKRRKDEIGKRRRVRKSKN